MVVQVCGCCEWYAEGQLCSQDSHAYREGMIVVGKMPHGVCGGSLDISILWSHYVVQQVLRALPAETKVDGLPRASSKIYSGLLYEFSGGNLVTRVAESYGVY